MFHCKLLVTGRLQVKGGMGALKRYRGKTEKNRESGWGVHSFEEMRRKKKKERMNEKEVKRYKERGREYERDIHTEK